jgi:hypothetical protein
MRYQYNIHELFEEHQNYICKQYFIKLIYFKRLQDQTKFIKFKVNKIDY